MAPLERPAARRRMRQRLAVSIALFIITMCLQGVEGTDSCSGHIFAVKFSVSLPLAKHEFSEAKFKEAVKAVASQSMEAVPSIRIYVSTPSAVVADGAR